MPYDIARPESAAIGRTRIHQLSTTEALISIGGRPEGLTVAEALQRLRRSGPNYIEKYVREPAIFRLLKELFQFFSLILWVAALLAFVAEWYEREWRASVMRSSL